MQLLAGWVRSAANPADDPTRGARLRKPEFRSDELEAQIEASKCELRYPYEATVDMWHEKGWCAHTSDRLFDHTMGYPGEGPRLVWAGQQADRRDTDLRVRVQPATARRYGMRLKAFPE
eukprot:735887-Amphidinium_carterae.5